MNDVTVLLEAANAGSPGAEERLWEIVYVELRRMAGEMMARENREVTLSGTVLLHEAWLRLAGPDGTTPVWDSRRHFFAAAAEAMRRILVDQARARLRHKRGGGHAPVAMEMAAQLAAPEPDDKLLMVHDVLDELALQDPRRAHIVKLRFFAGFTHDEIAAALGISEITVRRQWKLAKVWMIQALTAVDGSTLLTDQNDAG